ncbi:alpha/beta fold hydrolase [Nocardia asteroides NBRC 15531]|uniref:AB hydrolase-1 domain-containing protein n=1 Tax=Nocardia asteroides NBRC 15531 TaxID=1110697 RepID=U5E3A8_NOCAS|nr:alpha/beta hydrolase [Nocardia asteroides]TLF66747.1 alpha/beta fold hydrolase [Nocardia asteroides NBRC 15531]UGT46139.1 alpha/beta fold hydrolase [Nocardia asteroides]SFM99930.1 Pimeloyl-ACP methyl ester carboxylesterase [Nocardia asteroides]VEG35068.1 Dihydrolipoyllysine-residue acetyltransferase component of acetoin cleaving system [Nocardia asteroides]GAD82207.1 hypothetical protein NCAST_08_00790 [Nocardia asteroides NBRC 15531]
MDVSVEPAAQGGRGEPLVLLHDLGLSWHSWGRCVEGLTRAYAVWAPTLPGHWGGPAFEGAAAPSTMTDAVERMLDDAGLARAHLVGNGFGAWIAAELARRGRAGSVTLVAPLGLWHDAPSVAESITHELARRHAVSPFLALVRNPVAGAMTRRAALRSLTGRSAPALLDLCPTTRSRALITTVAPTHCTVTRAILRSPEFAEGWRPEAGPSPVTTVVTGGQDRLMHRSARELFPDPHIRAYHRLEHGRVPMLDDPDPIIRYIDAGAAAAPWLPGPSGGPKRTVRRTAR